MLDEDLMRTWKKAEAGAPPLSPNALEELLRPMARRTGRTLLRLLRFYVVLPAASFVLSLSNVALFRGNGTMLAVESGIALLSLACAAAGLRLIGSLRGIDRAVLPLLESVEKRIALFEGAFRTWLVAASVTPWLLSLAINTRIDAVDGTYRIHQPLEFTVISALMIGITYVMLRVSLSATAFEMHAVLHDLRAEALDHAPRIEHERRRTRLRMAVGIVLLSISVLVGLWLWWKGTGSG